MGSTQVPEGYKQTEGGVIPEDWDVKELASIIISGPKNGYSGQTGGDSIGTPTLRLTATSSGYIIINDETVKRLSETIDPNSDLFLQPGDVLIQRSNTYELVGTTAIFNGPSRTYIYPDLMMRLRFQDQLAAHWFWKYANSVNGRRFFLSIAAGSSGSMPKISGAKLRRMKIPFPSKEEQRSIAQALSDVDALIAALDKLIAKKCHLKTATMQQLLTGKMRLPGFDKDWKIKKIGDFTDCTAGGTPSTAIDKYWGGNIKWMSSGELHQKFVKDVKERITEEGLSNSSTKIVPSNCVLIGLAGQGKTRGTVALNMLELCTNQSIAAIYPNNNFEPMYLYYNLDNRYEELRELSAGDGGRGGLNLSIIRNITVPFPSKKEQSAIAQVLSDMDAEITALETRRAKTQAIKQGMMQELLTGRTRLI
jgi:type I restriction enzyme, S subunit